MSSRKVHFRIPTQVRNRVYTGMQALCGNKRAKTFDVSAKDDAATCKPCIVAFALQRFDEVKK